MIYTWRCQKCFRYLANINTNSLSSAVTQRTVCPRCKSENKITLNENVVVTSCGFSKKFESNLHRMTLNIAPETSILLVDKSSTILENTIIKTKKTLKK